MVFLKTFLNHNTFSIVFQKDKNWLYVKETTHHLEKTFQVHSDFPQNSYYESCLSSDLYGQKMRLFSADYTPLIYILFPAIKFQKDF